MPTTGSGRWYHRSMPLYEFRCPDCEARETVFTRTVTTEVEPPRCPNASCRKSVPMARAITKFARHLNDVDKVAEAEARFGKEVDASMGPERDIGYLSRRYERLAKDLPPSEMGVGHD